MITRRRPRAVLLHRAVGKLLQFMYILLLEFIIDISYVKKVGSYMIYRPTNTETNSLLAIIRATALIFIPLLPQTVARKSMVAVANGGTTNQPTNQPRYSRRYAKKFRLFTLDMGY